MLLTRPPLVARVAPALPFDLHVLGMPLAFNLSQDQTLQLYFLTTEVALNFTDELQSLIKTHCFLTELLYIDITWQISPIDASTHLNYLINC